MKKKKNPHAQPNVWGTHAWSFLHCVVMTYPNRPSLEQQANMTVFLHSLGNVLPCKLCRKNFRKYISNHPIQVQSKTKLRDWVIDLHNAINQRLGKPILSHEEALHQIESVCKKQ